jgi:hypothetical protein
MKSCELKPELPAPPRSHAAAAIVRWGEISSCPVKGVGPKSKETLAAFALAGAVKTIAMISAPDRAFHIFITPEPSPCAPGNATSHRDACSA